jgi:hypothetical protein
MTDAERRALLARADDAIRELQNIVAALRSDHRGKEHFCPSCGVEMLYVGKTVGRPVRHRWECVNPQHEAPDAD